MPCGISVSWGRTNAQPDSDTSGDRWALPNLRYPTRSSAKVLILRFTVYSIFTVPFSIVHQAFGWAGSKNLCPIDRLATNQHIPLNKTENVEEFCESALDKTYPDRSWFLLMHPIPITDFFCLFHPYLSRGWLWWTPMLTLCCKATSSGLMLTLVIRGQIWCV